MKALITGIAGFAGSHLADLLLNKGFKVEGISHPDFPLHNIQHCLDRINISQIDITSFQAFRNTIHKFQPEYIFHLAAISSVSHSWKGRETVFNTNAKGSFNLLEACRELKNFPKILLVSSGETYGPIENRARPAKEDQPLNPCSPYAATKVVMEIFGRQYASTDGLPVYIARAFNHTGPRQSSQFVCSSLAKQIASTELALKEPKLYIGNLEAERDFSDVRDIVKGYLQILLEGKVGEAYNLCSGNAISIKEILNNLLSYCSREIEVIQKESLFRPSDLPLLLGDNTKANKELNWKTEIELGKTLSDLLDYWRKQFETDSS